MSDSLPLHELQHAMLFHPLLSPRVCSHSYPVYLDSYIPGTYAILFFTASGFTFITRHIHSWASFLLWPSHFILSGAVSNCLLLFPSSILDIFWPGELGVRDEGGYVCYFPVLYLFTFFYCPWGSPSKSTGWSRLPFPPSVDQGFSELFTMTHPSWMALHGMAHSCTVIKAPLLWQGCDPWRGVA